MADDAAVIPALGGALSPSCSRAFRAERRKNIDMHPALRAIRLKRLVSLARVIRLRRRT